MLNHTKYPVIVPQLITLTQPERNVLMQYWHNYVAAAKDGVCCTIIHNKKVFAYFQHTKLLCYYKKANHKVGLVEYLFLIAGKQPFTRHFGA